jgi:hypothetical protein
MLGFGSARTVLADIGLRAWRDAAAPLRVCEFVTEAKVSKSIKTKMVALF